MPLEDVLQELQARKKEPPAEGEGMSRVMQELEDRAVGTPLNAPPKFAPGSAGGQIQKELQDRLQKKNYDDMVEAQKFSIQEGTVYESYPGWPDYQSENDIVDPMFSGPMDGDYIAPWPISRGMIPDKEQKQGPVELHGYRGLGDQLARPVWNTALRLAADPIKQEAIEAEFGWLLAATEDDDVLGEVLRRAEIAGVGDQVKRELDELRVQKARGIKFNRGDLKRAFEIKHEKVAPSGKKGKNWSARIIEKNIENMKRISSIPLTKQGEEILEGHLEHNLKWSDDDLRHKYNWYEIIEHRAGYSMHGYRKDEKVGAVADDAAENHANWTGKMAWMWNPADHKGFTWERALDSAGALVGFGVKASLLRGVGKAIIPKLANPKVLAKLKWAEHPAIMGTITAADAYGDYESMPLKFVEGGIFGTSFIPRDPYTQAFMAGTMVAAEGGDLWSILEMASLPVIMTKGPEKLREMDFKRFEDTVLAQVTSGVPGTPEMAWGAPLAHLYSRRAAGQNITRQQAPAFKTLAERNKAIDTLMENDLVEKKKRLINDMAFDEKDGKKVPVSKETLIGRMRRSKELKHLNIQLRPYYEKVLKFFEEYGKDIEPLLPPEFKEVVAEARWRVDNRKVIDEFDGAADKAAYAGSLKGHEALLIYTRRRQQIIEEMRGKAKGKRREKALLEDPVLEALQPEVVNVHQELYDADVAYREISKNAEIQALQQDAKRTGTVALDSLEVRRKGGTVAEGEKSFTLEELSDRDKRVQKTMALLRDKERAYIAGISLEKLYEDHFILPSWIDETMAGGRNRDLELAVVRGDRLKIERQAYIDRYTEQADRSDQNEAQILRNARVQWLKKQYWDVQDKIKEDRGIDPNRSQVVREMEQQGIDKARINEILEATFKPVDDRPPEDFILSNEERPKWFTEMGKKKQDAVTEWIKRPPEERKQLLDGEKTQKAAEEKADPWTPKSKRPKPSRPTEELEKLRLKLIAWREAKQPALSSEGEPVTERPAPPEPTDKPARKQSPEDEWWENNQGRWHDKAKVLSEQEGKTTAPVDSVDDAMGMSKGQRQARKRAWAEEEKSQGDYDVAGAEGTMASKRAPDSAYKIPWGLMPFHYKGKNADMIEDFMKGMLTTQGKLPKEAWMALFEGNAEFGARIERLKQLMFKLRKAHGKHEGLKVPHWAKFDPDLSDILNRFMDGTLDKTGKNEHWRYVPAHLRLPLEKIKQEKHEMSREMIALGMIEGDLIPKFMENIDYLTRSYDIIVNPNTFWPSDAVWAQATSFMKKMWPELTHREAALRARDVFEEMRSAASPMELLLAEDGMEGHFGQNASAPPGTYSRKVFMKRGIIPEEIMDLWGRRTGFEETVTDTWSRMATAITQHKALEGIVKAGEGDWLFAKDDPRRALPENAQYTKLIEQIPGRLRKPLDGYYTTQTIANALNNYGEHLSPGILWPLTTANALAKFESTVGSLKAHARNFKGNFRFMLASGNALKLLNPRHRKNMIDLFGLFVAYEAGWKGNDAITGLVNRMMKTGAIGGEVNIKEYELYLRDVFRGGVDHYLSGMVTPGVFEAVGGYAKRKIGKGKTRNKVFETVEAGYDVIRPAMVKGELFAATPVRAAVDIARVAYRFEDRIFKAIQFVLEADAYSKSYPKASQDEIDKMAARAVQMTTPSYDFTPAVIKWLRIIPTHAPFPVFQYQAWRTMFTTAKLAIEDLSKPETRDIGYRRLGGMLAAATLPEAARLWYLSRAGMNQDDDTYARYAVPHWAKNGRLMFMSNPRDNGGYLEYVNDSYVDPFSYAHDMIYAIWAGKDWQTKFFEGMKEGLSSFVSDEIFWKAHNEWARNAKAESGAHLYNPEAGWDDLDQGKYASYARDVLWKTLAPATLRDMGKVMLSLEGPEVSRSGKVLDPMIEIQSTFFGQRLERIHLPTAFSFKVNDYREGMTDAKKLLSIEANDPQSHKHNKHYLRDRYRRMETARRRVFQEHRDMVVAFRHLGVSQKDMEDIFTIKGLGKLDQAMLLNGIYRPWIMSENFLTKIMPKPDVPQEVWDQRRGWIAEFIREELRRYGEGDWWKLLDEEGEGLTEGQAMRRMRKIFKENRRRDRLKRAEDDAVEPVQLVKPKED